MGHGRPVPILIVGGTLLGLFAQLGLDAEGRCVRRFGGELRKTLLALAGEGQVVTLPDGALAHPVVGHAAFDGGHRTEKAHELVDGNAHEGARKEFVATQRGEPEDGGYIGVCVVFRRGCPSADDRPHSEGLAEGLVMLPIAFEGLPGGTVAVGHTLELYETFVGLLGTRTLPAVGRVADVERIVVADSSGHVFEF